jgi:hypothetical protein
MLTSLFEADWLVWIHEETVASQFKNNKIGSINEKDFNTVKANSYTPQIISHPQPEQIKPHMETPILKHQRQNA